MNNIVKTTFLLSLLTILLVVMGGAVGGQGGMIVAFLIAAVMNFCSYWFSDKIVLKMYNAQEITHNEEKKALEKLTKSTSKSISEIMREAIDRWSFKRRKLCMD